MLRFGTINRIVIALFCLLLITNYWLAVPVYLYGIIAFIWFTLTVFGSFFIQWNYHLTSHHKNKKIEENKVAITFDDGPHPEFTPQVLELLEKYNAKATFFCIGKEIKEHQAIVSTILEKGHTIGNHTYSHTRNFGFLSTEKVKQELEQTNALVKAIFNKSMRLYRPAFGVTNPRIKQAVQDTNLTSIGWSVRSLDTTKRSKNMVVRRITKNLKKGDIILLHDTSAKSVAVLEQLLLFLQQKKMQSIPVNELLDIVAYE
ncbi:peptidoglycan/xylan/chitin deacetylase (PgdA/CDA1 family) [Maribacter vaceletii]|uniref:Peptidoglycan/xylan/chitin deacetylase (PgdA/CDA1 family) n=1 Tax=Maribacter vaceletii TaxID=1206816 RepID=A0A495ECE9_9FLAO|nr:polysaccharide deacetylase family protein [Maribacter vaceletii]RKR14496.1 peptidoglycan/xylan/chitin deacetylase (PgdA/CDA1 family) [Maribacter vaceletii]